MITAAVGMVGASMVGAGVGWAASALTLTGRVEAIEKGFARLESLLINHLKSLGESCDEVAPKA